MDEVLKISVETIIREREGKHKYFGGAAARIIAQIPKDITDKEKLIDELEAAFTREERYYT